MVPIIADSLTEPDETFTIDLTEPVNATIADAQGLCTISDGPPSQLPTLSINDITVVEGDSGTSQVDFTVTLSHSTGQQVAFQYMTAPGTATEATPGHAFTGLEDYSWGSGAALFGPGVVSRTISVPIIGDFRDEFDETFFLNISNATNATIADSQGMATILDDDPTPTVSVNDLSIKEGNSGTTSAFFIVSLSTASGKPISVDFATSNGTATAGSDYDSISGVVSFNPGETTKTLAVGVKGDTTIEQDETFFVTLANPQNVMLGRAQATGTIVDDDTPTVRLTATDYPISENSANGFVTVSAIREGDATSAASVKYATSDTSSLNASCSQVPGKASERCDYATSLGTVSWAAGEAGTKSFNIPIINDAWVEGTETFNVTLSNPLGVSLGTSTATVTIQDNDTTLSSSNPIDGVDFFITEQYIDFLGRMPDQGGFANWQATLAPCPNGGIGENGNPKCDRIHVAAGFFQSDEFLNRGYWAFRFYMVSYNQRPRYSQFIPDMAQVGGPKSPAQEEASKVAFADAYVQRPEFVAKYPGLSGQALANALWQTAGLPSSTFTVSGSMTNGQILRGIAETTAAFNQFLTDGTVAIQYFGFLRRDPDTIGYQNNLATLRSDPNNLRHMIFIFIYSSEYRGRFGPP